MRIDGPTVDHSRLPKLGEPVCLGIRWLQVVGVPRRQQRLLSGFAPLRESDRAVSST